MCIQYTITTKKFQDQCLRLQAFARYIFDATTLYRYKSPKQHDFSLLCLVLMFLYIQGTHNPHCQYFHLLHQESLHYLNHHCQHLVMSLVVQPFLSFSCLLFYFPFPFFLFSASCSSLRHFLFPGQFLCSFSCCSFLF